jgi:hypothetical protein
MQICLHVNVSVRDYCSILNKTELSRQMLVQTSQYQILLKSVQRFSVCYMRTDGPTHMAKLTSALLHLFDAL